MHSYSPTEVRSVINEHKVLLRQIEIAREAVQLAGKRIVASVDVLAASQGLGDGLVKLDDTKQSSQTRELLANAKAYSRVWQDYSSLRMLDDLYNDKIESAIRSADSISSTIKRIFQGQLLKNKANESCGFLQQLLEGDYARSVRSLSNGIVTGLNSALPTADFTEEDVNTAKDIVERLAHGRIYPSDYPSDMPRLTADLTALRNSITTIKSTKQDYSQPIRKQALDLHKRETVRQLSMIPVEEINRDKLGIRTNVLRDNGIQTVADVCATSRYRLEAIKGISEDSSYTIVDMANKITDEVAKNSKVKLTADDESAESKKLITSIAGYILQSEADDKYKAALSDFINKLNELLSHMSMVSNASKWLNADEYTKQQASEGLNRLKSAEGKALLDSITEDLAAYNRAYNVQYDDAKELFTANPIAFATALESTVPELCETEDTHFGLPEDLAKEIEQQCYFPDGLKCTLRRYQEWGVKYILHQEKVLLGDEMGLGKTVQAIAAMVSLRNTGATHFMVVCPASVLTNWTKEVVKHSKLSVIQVYGNNRAAALEDWVKNGGVAVTTYETTTHINLESNFKLSILVVDEAHYVKNPDANRTANVLRVSKNAERILFMTGTPLENNVDEMITLMKHLQPAVAAQAKQVSAITSANEFKKRIAPVYYRRKRADVMKELPELIEKEDWCNLSSEEEKIYEKSILARKYTDARRVSWSVNDWEKSCKALRLKEIVEQAAADGRKVLVFSFFLNTISMVCEMFGAQAMPPINGSISPQKRQEIIDDFEKAQPGTVLPAQIQAGGTGLNIQSASVVVLCEPQFKPSIENQAISRAYRMGQSRNVLVYRLLCDDTVDERIMKLLEEKQKQFDAFADESVAAKESMEIDEKTFGDLITEEIDRINKKNEAAQGGNEMVVGGASA